MVDLDRMLRLLFKLREPKSRYRLAREGPIYDVKVLKRHPGWMEERGLAS